MPDLEPWRWGLAALCALFVGMAKTGVPGLGVFAVPLMVLAVGDARQSAGWLLPLLCVADVFAVVYYRRHAETRRLFSLIPAVLVGMAAGGLALGGSESVLRRLVGGIVLLMVALRLRARRSPAAGTGPGSAGVAADVAAAPALDPARPTTCERPARVRVEGWAYGVLAGFATTVANAAGPVMTMYLFARRLPKEQFIATGAWFFLVVNLSKLPLYGGLGLLHRSSLLFDLVLVPAVVLGARAGRALFERLPQRQFERVVLGLTALAALLLLLPPLRF